MRTTGAGGKRPIPLMPPSPSLVNAAKQRVYVFALALAVPALLAWWAYTLSFDRANRFLLVMSPVVALVLLWVLIALLRGTLSERAGHGAYALLYVFSVGALLSRFWWPTPLPLRGLESELLIIVSLVAYLLLAPRPAALASGMLYGITVLTSWTLLAREGASSEVWYGTAIRQGADLTVIALLYTLALLRQWWGEESASRALHQRLADTDALTELPNRRGMYRILGGAVERARHEAFCVVLADVDAFKSINDVYGHAVGDAVLRGVGEALRAELRGVDEVGRWGGEEFLAVLPGTTLEDARHVAERLRSRVEEAELLSGQPVTASFGVARWRSGDTLDALLQRADTALYQAKHEGKNRVCTEAPFGD